MEIINVSDQIIEVNVTNDIVVIQAQTGAYPLPNNVYSVFGRVGNVVALEGDYTLDQLSGVTISSPTNGQVLKYNGTTWVNGTDNNSVTSVFGRTGTITAESGDYTTLKVTENTNLYFTNQRARYAVSGDSNSGVVYSNTTGIIALDDIPNTSLLHDSMTINGKLTALGGTVTLTTTDVAEGTNLYYTQTRFDNALAAKSTTNLAEGTNLYFTNTRAQAAITGTSPISVTSGNVTISQASATTNGYLSSTDWAAFNSKQGVLTLTTTGSSGSATLVSGTLNIPTYTLAGLGGISLTSLSASSPLSYNSSTGAFSIQAASSTQNGYLTSANWTTFNNKQAALSGTGFVKSTAGVISYDTNTYLTTISGIAAGGELSGTYANPSLVNSAVTGKVLTGVNITGGTIQDTDSILTAFGKVQNQINGLIGGSIYKGTWNASTNTPALASGVGTTGWYYIVNVAGSTNLDGITDWNVGDWAIFDGTAWQQVDNTDAVVSVNGFTGAVSLTTSNITEGTNLYYTDTRARASNSAGTGISYNSTTGVITNSAPDQTVALTAGTGITTSGTYPNFTITNSAPDRTVALTGGGTTTITGTYPNFTISSADQYTGTVTSVGVTSSAAALTVTNSPITTSGNIGVNFAGSSTQYVAGDGSLVTFPTVVTQAQNLVTEVYNETGATLTKGTVVYVNGGHGNLPTIAKAIATGDSTSAQTYGVVRTDITNNNNGYVTVIGNLDNIDTQAYTAGTQLYLSSTTAGGYTSTKQYAPAHLVYVGIVVRQHPTQGVIEVRIQNGFEMDELHNVSAQSPNNNDLLQYKTSTGLWTTAAGTTSNISEGTNLYYTDARSRAAIALTTTGSSGASTYNNTTGALNIPTYTLAGLGGINLTSLSATSPLLYNNTTGVFSIQQSSGSQAGYLSSADWTTFNSKQAALTNPVTGTGTTNYHTKFTGTSTIGNSLIWDNGTNVCIGNTNTSYTFDVTGTGRFTGNLTLTGSYADFQNTTYIRFSNTGGGTRWGYIQHDGTNMAFANDISGGIFSFNKAATFSSSVTSTIANGYFLSAISATTSEIYARMGNTSGFLSVGVESSTGGNIVTGSSAYAAVISQYQNNPLQFATNNITRVTINGSGNVGIGTSSPSYKTVIQTANDTIGLLVTTNANDTETGLYIRPDNTNGIVKLYASGNSDKAFGFFTGNTERTRITSGGNVLIGSTTDNGTKLQVSGGIKTSTTSTSGLVLNALTGNSEIDWQNNGTTKWVMWHDVSNNQLTFCPSSFATGVYLGYTATSWAAYSDKRIKKDIIDLDYGLDTIMKIKPRRYKLIANDIEDIGFIAQELKEVLPEAVIGEEVEFDENDTKYERSSKTLGVTRDTIIPVLVKAIQELKAEIDLLKSK
jgi:hypothetical protein